MNLRNLFRPKNTEPLPWKETRAVVDTERLCIIHNEHAKRRASAARCAKIPSEIITVVPGGRHESPATGKKRGTCKDFILDLNACIVCELCVQVCPEDAILMLKVQEEPGYQREDLVLTMDKLYANEKLGATTWATGAKLIEMQAPPPPPPNEKPAPPAEPTPATKPESAETPASKDGES